METVEVTVWVLVNEAGEAVADCDSEHLNEEWEADHGDIDATLATRLVQITLTIPKPQPIAMTGLVPAEVCEGGELKVA